MAKFIAVYGTIALTAAFVAWLLAFYKRRPASYWATITLLFPPMLFVLIVMQRNAVARHRREGMEAEEDRQLRHEESY